jgi:hypothetical protein
VEWARAGGGNNKREKTFQEWYPGNFFKVSFAGIWKIWSVSRFGNEKEKSEDVWESIFLLYPFGRDFRFFTTNLVGEAKPNTP